MDVERQASRVNEKNMKENLNKNMFKAIWMINVCDISIQLAWLRGEACGAVTSWK